ncbi:hypothetical protein [Actinomadura sp. CNU-125]|uniref:hypothetical protein n=1 Tax=Actinomadura sp. CNU-125 TaxID=1904961 RepID=UPI0011787848|nr:hypothetical protein [Actinomadura sp. CNU-125]
MESLFRLLAEAGPTAWIAVFIAAMITVLIFYLGVAMVATLTSRDQQRGKMRYRVFTDLLRLFRHWGAR